MTIKAGQIIHDARGFVLDRIQSAGGNITIPQEKIYEVGNYQTVATIRDIPDLSFDVQSFDVGSCEVEAILTNHNNPSAIAASTAFDFTNNVPVNIISPFKTANSFTVVKGVALPYLTLERAVYRFGVGQNSTQDFTLRGDAILYIPGAPYYQEFTNAGITTYNFAHTGIEYVEQGVSLYAYAVMAKHSTTNAYKRLFVGTDYTNTSTGFTTIAANASYDTLCVVYGSATSTTYAQILNQGVSVKPAAIRGKDIDVYIGSTAATPVFTRWASVQSAEVTRSVNLETDQEFGNDHYVSRSYITADVTGSIVIKAADIDELFLKVQQVAGIAADKVVGPFTSVVVPIEIRVSDPDTGTLLKTLYVSDARFTIPSSAPRANQKLDSTFAFQSDGGNLIVFKGARQ